MNAALRAPAAGAVRARRLARPLSRSPRGAEEDAEAERPLVFSRSPAHPARWSVRRSLGGEQQRPWWRVLALSLPLALLLAWCYRREESASDLWLERALRGEAAGPGGRGPGG